MQLLKLKVTLTCSSFAMNVALFPRRDQMLNRVSQGLLSTRMSLRPQEQSPALSMVINWGVEAAPPPLTALVLLLVR
jgi:hypothetical protein